jgi:hypothetical protein
MSVSILQSPAAYTPAYNDNVFVVTSDHVNSEANFKYIADVIVNGQTFRLSVYPHPTYKTGVFNIGRIVENYITNTLTTDASFQENVGSLVGYTVQFGEEFGLSSSGTTVYSNQTSSSKTVWSGVIDFLPYSSYSYTNYVSGSSAANVLTSAPSSGVIRDNEKAWLSVLNESSGTIYYAKIQTYDSSSNLIQTVRVKNNYQALTSTNSAFVRFSTGTDNLNDIPSSGVITGSLPIITASVARYSVVFETFAGTAKTNTYWYTVDNTCTKNNTYRFHFLNKLGGWDSFTFIRADKKKLNITRSSYKTNQSDMLTSTTYGYTAKSPNMIDYNIKLTESIRVQSDWISESTCDWLSELYTSPQVYVEDSTYGFVAVNILNNTYDFKQEATDKLFNIEIEFRYSYDQYRQRR